MRTHLTSFTAALVLAMAFTLSCSADDLEKLLSDQSSSSSHKGSSSSRGNNGGGSSSSSGGNNGGGGTASDAGVTVKIGTQTWMKKNLDYNAPGSKCYDNDPANCVKYGRLYDWATAMALPSKCNSVLSTSDADCAISAKHRGICPSGWHIPSDADWDALMKVANPSCSDNSYDCAGAGTKLKSATGWSNSYGYAPIGTDDFGFSALPGGGGFSDDDDFYDAGKDGEWWSATEYNSDGAYYRYMGYLNEDAHWNYSDKSFLSSVRCLQD